MPGGCPQEGGKGGTGLSFPHQNSLRLAGLLRAAELLGGEAFLMLNAAQKSPHPRFTYPASRAKPFGHLSASRSAIGTVGEDLLPCAQPGLVAHCLPPPSPDAEISLAKPGHDC